METPKPKPKLGIDAFADILERFGITGTRYRIPFMQDGHRMMAEIDVHKLYDIIDVFDWDEIQA